MLTLSQVKWAASHDWFRSDNGDGTIVVADCYTDRDGKNHNDIIPWTKSFRALRDWAGY